MKKLLTYAHIMCLALITMASCSTLSHTTKNTKGSDPTFEARKQLTLEQQREYDKLYLEAINQKLNGHTDAAHELLEEALNINPNASETLYELALMQLSLSSKGDSTLVAQGAEMLQKAYNLEPSNPYFRATLAEHFIRTAEFEKAAELYEKIVDDKPDAQNVATLTRLYEMTHDLRKAHDVIDRLEQLEGYTEQIAVEKYRINMEMMQIDEANECIERLCRENPNELRYQVMLADVYMAQDKKEQALETYGKVLEADPGNKLVKTSMLSYYANEGDTVSFNKGMTEIMLDEDFDNERKTSILQSYAIDIAQGAKGISKEMLYSHFEEALSIPQEDTNIADLCNAFVEVMKMPDEYRLMPLKAILRDDPENRETRLLLLQYYVQNHMNDEAIDLCHEGTLHSPDELIFYYYEGMMLYLADRTDESLEANEKGVTHINEESDPEIVSNMYESLGDAYHNLGQNEKAYEAYEAALKAKEDNIGCLNNYAYFLAVEGRDLDKALEMCKKMIAIEPNEPNFLDTYAWVLFKLQQFTQARIYIDQTIKSLPAEETESESSANLYDHAGDIYYKCGEAEKALEFWNHALKLSADDDLTKKLNKKIKNKRI